MKKFKCKACGGLGYYTPIGNSKYSTASCVYCGGGGEQEATADSTPPSPSKNSAESCELLTEKQRNTIAKIRNNECLHCQFGEDALAILDDVVEMLNAKVEARKFIMAELNKETAISAEQAEIIENMSYHIQSECTCATPEECAAFYAQRRSHSK